MTKDQLIQEIFIAVEKSPIDKKDIAKEAGIHANTMRRILNTGGADLDSVFRIAKAVGLEININKLSK